MYGTTSFVDSNCDLSKNCWGISMNEILGFLGKQMDVPAHPIPIDKETKETETSGDPLVGNYQNMVIKQGHIAF
jgi:hypothetical protein